MNQHPDTPAGKTALSVAPFEAVIFDMDGTLIASTEADYLAWKRLFAEHGRTLTFEQYFPLLGRKSSDVVHQELGLYNGQAAEAMQRKMEYFADVVAENGMQLIPFADRFVQQVSTFPVQVALATSSRRAKTELVLKLVRLYDYFTVLVTGEEVEAGKPSPDIFLKTAAKLKVRPEHAIVVEDTVSGVLAAKRAGMKCVAITTSHDAAQLTAAGADMVIPTYEGLDFALVCRQLQQA